MKYKPKFKVGDELIIIKPSCGYGSNTDYFHDEDWKVGNTFIVDFMALYPDTSCYFACFVGDDGDKSGVMEEALELLSISKTKLYKALK